MLGSGRDKIETKEQMEASKKVRCTSESQAACKRDHAVGSWHEQAAHVVARYP